MAREQANVAKPSPLQGKSLDPEEDYAALFKMTSSHFLKKIIFPPFCLLILSFIFYQFIRSNAGGMQDYVQLTNILKGAAFLMICYVSYMTAVDENNKLIKNCNFVLVIVILFMAIVILAKAVDPKLHEILAEIKIIGDALSWLITQSYWVTTLPLVAFFALDLIQYWLMPDRRDRVLVYLLVVDMICVVPIILVILMGFAHRAPGTAFGSDETELFIGGAMAFLCIAHAFAEKISDWITDRIRDSKDGAAGR